MSVATRATPESSITIYTVERELVCYVYLCHHSLHLLKLLNQGPFIGYCHCTYIFIPCLTFGVVAAILLRRPEPTKVTPTNLSITATEIPNLTRFTLLWLLRIQRYMWCNHIATTFMLQVTLIKNYRS